MTSARAHYATARPVKLVYAEPCKRVGVDATGRVAFCERPAEWEQLFVNGSSRPLCTACAIEFRHSVSGSHIRMLNPTEDGAQ